MGKADYKVDYKEKVVKLNDSVVAKFDDDLEITEFTGDMSKRGRWIREVIAENIPKEMAPEPKPDEDIGLLDLIDIRKGRKRMEDVFYDVPDPIGNKIGRDHPEIYKWVEKNYPQHMETLYPRGRYDAEKAGLGRNLALIRTKDGAVDLA